MLFQLPSSMSQIEAAEAHGDTSAANQFRKSDMQIKHAILRDFKENYQYDSVYFFESADVDKLKNGKLDELLLLNLDGQQIQTPKKLQDYWIANVSFYPKEFIQVEKNGQTVEEETTEQHFGLGIILRNPNYAAVKGKLRFTPCKIAKRGSLFNKKKRYYVFWGAKPFNEKMVKFANALKSSQ